MKRVIKVKTEESNQFLFLGMTVEELVRKYDSSPKEIMKVLIATKAVEFLIEFYDILHTQDLSFVVEDVEQFVKKKGWTFKSQHLGFKTKSYTGVMYGSVCKELYELRRGTVREVIESFLTSTTAEELSKDGRQLETMGPLYVAKAYLDEVGQTL